MNCYIIFAHTDNRQRTNEAGNQKATHQYENLILGLNVI